MTNQSDKASYSRLESTSTRRWIDLCILLVVLSTAFLMLFLWSRRANADSRTISPDAPGSISGKVTSDNGEPLANIQVNAFQVSDSGYDNRRVTTANDGTYVIPVLSTGLYHLYFSDPTKNYAPEYFDNTTQSTEAKDIVVAGNRVANLDIALSPGGQITGTLALINGMPISSVSVLLYDPTSAGSYSDSSRIDTNPTSYRLVGLPTGLYRVCAIAQSAYGEFGECYNNSVSDVSRAMPVSVTTGTVTPAINFVFGDGADAAQAHGHVTNAQGMPLASIQVTASYSQTDSSTIAFPITVVSDADGSFYFNQLIPGIYNFRFVDPAGAYASQYLSGTVNSDEAVAISLAPHAIKRDINVQLVPGGQITGDVTIRGIRPDAIFELQLLWQNRGTWVNLAHLNPFGSITGIFPIEVATGTYTVTGLSAGVFQIKTIAILGNRAFTGDYTSPITLTMGEKRSNVDIDLGQGDFEAALRGQVTGSGIPLSGIKVTLYKDSEVVHVFTDADGNYAIEGLDAGDYRVGFSDPNKIYAFSFYNGYLRLNDCAWFHLEKGEIRTGIDAALALGGSIRGRVQRKDGTPVKGLGVFWFFERMPNDNIYIPINLSSPAATTDDNGEYLLKGLPAHRYQIAFTENTNPPVIEYSLTTIIVESGKISNGDHLWGPDYSVFLPVVKR